MSTVRRYLTSSGVLGAPEGGAMSGIVPARHVSSSNYGRLARRDTGSVREFVVGNYEREFPPILRLRGGGEDTGGGGEREGTEQAGPPSPVVCSRTRPGPKCSKGKEKERGGQGRNRKERDWMEGRKIQSSSEEEEERTGKDKKEEDEEHMPESPLEIVQRAREACESARKRTRSLSGERSPTNSHGKPRVVAVTTLEGPNRIRMPSPGMKRGREEEDEEMEVVVEKDTNEEDEDDTVGLSSRESSANREGGASTDQEGPPGKKRIRKGRGRPAKDPSHEGQFTAEKLKMRAKRKELERVEKKELDILNPEIKATSHRAEEVGRHALRIVDDLRETPNPELTERSLRAIEAIKKVASTSKNMKGAFVGALWKATEELTALSMTFTTRLRGKEGEHRDGLGDEVDKLRSELSAMRTEHALMAGENRRLREQVADLRERVVKGETITYPPPPPPPSHSDPVKGRSGRRVRKRGPKAAIRDSSSSTDVEMEEALERELSPQAKAEGIRARKEVSEDLYKGTLPPAIRPALKGKVRDLDVGLGGEIVAPAPVPPTPARPSAPTPPTGLSQEDIVRLVQATVSQLIPQLGGEGTRPDEGGEGAQGRQGSNKKATATAADSAPTKGEGGWREEEERRRGRGKRRGRTARGEWFPARGRSPQGY